MITHIRTAAVALVLFSIPALAAAHGNYSSANYIGVDDVNDSGGGNAASANYGQISAVGQGGQGTVSSANYFVHAGFLHPAPSSPTPTATPTITPTLTVTATLTSTPTFTHTSTATCTSTVSPTASITGTATLTPENTATASPTVTLTQTASATLTASATSTATLTASLTATATPSLTASPTTTISPTRTLSPTVSRTASITPTHTQTPARENPRAGLDLGGRGLMAYPNPAHGRMTFVFHLESAAKVEIHIFNLAGERTVVLSGDFPAGRGQMLAWNAHDTAPGIYLARMYLAGAEKAALKIAVVK